MPLKQVNETVLQEQPIVEEKPAVASTPNDNEKAAERTESKEEQISAHGCCCNGGCV